MLSQAMLVQLKEHQLGLKPSNKHWNNTSLPMLYLLTKEVATLTYWLGTIIMTSYRQSELSYQMGCVCLDPDLNIYYLEGKKIEYTAPKRDSLTMLTYSLSETSANSLGFNKTDESIFNNSHLEDFWALETIEIKNSLTITDDDKALS